MITKTDLFQVLISLSGVSKSGIQFAFKLHDRTPAIKDVTDILRGDGGRIAGGPSTRERAGKGYLNVYMRVFGFDPASRQRIREVIKNKIPPLYGLDHEEKKREIF